MAEKPMKESVPPVPKTRKKPSPTNIANTNSTNSSNDTSHPNLVTALIEHNKVLDAKLDQIESEERKQQEKFDELQSQLDGLRQKMQNVDKEFDELSNNKEVQDSNAKTSQEIQSLLAVYERLKSDEHKFKKTCREELERLQILASQSEDEVPQNEVDAQLERARVRVEAGRAELGAINRKLAILKRQIEQVPNRTELREYRLRFSELYNQVSATHRQTKHFYSLYNSLEDTSRYLEKELSLLNSIVDSYQQACSTTSGREDFLRQLSTLYEGMKETFTKVDKKCQSEKVLVDKLQHELQRLVEQKVNYEKCLKELENECKTNDRLLAKCKKMEAEQAKFKPPQAQPVVSSSDDTD